MSKRSNADNVVPLKRRGRTLDARAALQFMRESGGKDGVLEVASIAELARLLGWQYSRMHKAVERWEAAGRLKTEPTDNGRLRVHVPPDRRDLERGTSTGNSTGNSTPRKPGKSPGKFQVEELDTLSNSSSTSNTSQNFQLASPASPVPAAQTQISTSSERASGLEMSSPQSRFWWRWRRRRNVPPPPALRAVTVRLPLSWEDRRAYLIIIALTGIAAYFSIRGMVVLFPGAGDAIMFMTIAMETAKLFVAGWLAKHWKTVLWLWRGLLIGFVFGLMCINAVGLYSQLVSAHVGHYGEIVASNETDDARVAGQIDVEESHLADIKERVTQLDAVVAGAAAKGRANADDIRRSQRKERADLSKEREGSVAKLARLKTTRTEGKARGRAAESEAAPIQYLAEMLGIHRGGEAVIRWMIAAMVLCCDPLAVVWAAAIGGRLRMRAA